MHAAKTFQLKGSLFTLTVLKLQSIDFDTLTQELDKTIAQAPKFFNNAPIVVDLQPLANLGVDIDFEKLKVILKNAGLIPIGVRNGNPEQHATAADAHLAILPNIKSAEPVPETAQKPQVTQTASSTPAQQTMTRVITQPVRSGTQIYAQGGDLLILAPVSHGAEILADGNIHVYGPLRGRALAGVQGDTSARIFCTGLEAELISIAGHYKVSEEFKEAETSSNAITHIYLDNEQLHVTSV